jgi:hypothetical protein
MKNEKKRLTTATGIPYTEHENSMTVGVREDLFCCRILSCTKNWRTSTVREFRSALFTPKEQELMENSR